MSVFIHVLPSPRELCAMSSSLSVTTRSRTGLFLSYRDSTARTSRTRFDDTNEHDRLIDSDAGHIALDVVLPPTWSVTRISALRPLLTAPPRVDYSDQVQEILADTQAKSNYCSFSNPTPLTFPKSLPSTNSTPNTSSLASPTVLSKNVR